MNKKLRIAAAGIGVGVVSLAGAGLASAHSPGDSERRDAIQERVAEIVGVDATELGEALEQAREEIQAAEMEERLTQAVEDGTIPAEEADEIRAWLDARPDILDEIKGAGHQGSSNGGGLAERLATLVEDGTITQEEADEVLAWSDTRPEAMSELRPDKGERGRHHGRGEGRGHHGPGRGFQQRLEAGANGEIGRFGGFRFQLPPDFEAPQDTPPVDNTAI